MYRYGQSVSQDDVNAVKWFRLAAEQGNATAQMNLGEMYAIGKGIPADPVYAHMWGSIAAYRGNRFGEKVQNLAAEQMTSSEIEEAENLARECISKNYKGC